MPCKPRARRGTEDWLQTALQSMALFVLGTSPFFPHIKPGEAKPLPASLAEQLARQRSPQAEDKRIYERADRQSVGTSLLKTLQHLQTITFAVSSQLWCPQAQISWSPRTHLS